jgi:signal transduction histidine kinase
MPQSNAADGSVRWGAVGFLGLAALGLFTVLAFNAVRPPTVDEVERDVWRDWARAAVDDQGENIAGLVDRGRREACQRLIDNFGEIVADYGDEFVLRTNVRSIRVLTKDGDVFASWRAGGPLEEGGAPWRELDLPLSPDGRRQVGRLQISYKFNESTLESLPNIRRLAELHRAARWLVAAAAAVLAVAAIFHVLRLRERAARLRSQQATLDLAQQMCHELRNGLWAFSLEGRNVRRVFDLVERYFDQAPKALRRAAERLGIPPADVDRLRRWMQEDLAAEHLDPDTDILSANAMARDAHKQIENFSRYIHLTVEQLDRNLLGADAEWSPTDVRASEVWREADELLALRLRSSGVERVEAVETQQDWIRADRRALVHVFVNLIKNALEAMQDLPVGRRVMRFVVRDVAGEVECRLENSGRPIPPHALPRLFERGFTTKRGAGRGLGLAFVREAVNRMGGRIDVASDESLTAFTLRFPSSGPR